MAGRLYVALLALLAQPICPWGSTTTPRFSNRSPAHEEAAGSRLPHGGRHQHWEASAESRRLNHDNVPYLYCEPDHLKLVPVQTNACPPNPGSLPKCNQALAGQYCEGDGECGTSDLLNNCQGWDVYLKEVCGELDIQVETQYVGTWPGLAETAIVIETAGGQQLAFSHHPGYDIGSASVGYPPAGNEFLNNEDISMGFVPPIGAIGLIQVKLSMSGNHLYKITYGSNVWEKPFNAPNFFNGAPLDVTVKFNDGTVLLSPLTWYHYEDHGTHSARLMGELTELCNYDHTYLVHGCYHVSECMPGRSCVDTTTLQPIGDNMCNSTSICVCAPEASTTQGPGCLQAEANLTTDCGNGTDFVANGLCNQGSACNMTMQAIKDLCPMSYIQQLPQAAAAVNACSACSVAFRLLTEGYYGGICTASDAPNLAVICGPPCEGLYSNMVTACAYDVPAYEDPASFQQQVNQIMPVLDGCFQPQCINIPQTDAIKVNAAACRIT